jgi:methyl-accepting chemotaxis protein
MFRNLKIGTKLFVCFLVLGILPLLLIGFISLSKSSEALEKQAFQQLESVRDIKRGQVEDFFEQRRSDMGALIDTVSTLRRQAMDKLTAVREIKREAVARYLGTISAQALTFSEDRMVVDAMRTFSRDFSHFRQENAIAAADLERMKSELYAYYANDFSAEYERLNEGVAPKIDRLFGGLDKDSIALQYRYIAANHHPLGSKQLLDAANDASAYSRLHGQVHPAIASYLEKFGYYDIFLVDSASGDIVYSVFKEVDYSTSLIDGPFADSNFGEAFRRANAANNKDAVVMVDYARYTPSYEAPAAFVAAPIFDGERKLGVAIFQFPIDGLNAIMSERAGLGKTGETYLVGGDGLMRSDSYLDPEYHSVAASFANPEQGRVDSVATQRALAGAEGADVIVDYNGNPVLSAYAPLSFGGQTWALLAEVDLAEAFSPVDEQDREFYADYIKRYGYYDLFLINPDGQVFYTVTHEADYQTNMINGEYADSGLGRLTRQVLKSEAFDIVDFSPYGPSSGEPAAFIAQPLVHGGKIEVVVALQLSLEAINGFMTERSGMGQTGETYLVGPDKLMRSDSFLDPVNHTVKASFANPELGRVDSHAVAEALAGKSGSGIIIDYNGNRVLSAYAPLDVADLNWVLLAEIDEAEAFTAIGQIRLILVVVAVVALGAIILIALLIARGITKPIARTVNMVEELSRGNLDIRLEMDQGDEIGQMSRALDVFAANMKDEVVAAFEALAKGDLSFVAAGVIKHPLARANAALTDVMSQVQTVGKQIAAGSSQIADSSQHLSQGATVQASSLEEISASLNQMSAQTGGNAKNANQARDLAVAAQQAARGGEVKMQAMTTAMTEISSAAKDISAIIKTIDEIAFQTNLLALNAAVEAARAGQHGKGFAVVAEEVRNLAARSAKAAEETSDLIQGAVDKSVNGSSIAADTEASLREIVERISGVNELVGEIAVASQEQAQGIAQVSQGVGQIDQVTQQNTASAEESAAAAEQLSGQADHLKHMLERFKLADLEDQPGGQPLLGE